MGLTIIVPRERGLNDPAFRHVAGAVSPVEGEVLARAADPVAEHNVTPPHIAGELLSRLQGDLDAPPSDDKVCRGTLTSRAQYLLDIGQYGYQDARITPRGNMSPEDVVYWTWAIENVD